MNNHKQKAEELENLMLGVMCDVLPSGTKLKLPIPERLKGYIEKALEETEREAKREVLESRYFRHLNWCLENDELVGCECGFDKFKKEQLGGE